MKHHLVIAASLLQTGCVMVGGYTSGGGWFFWPGGWIGIAIMLALAIASFFLWR